MLSLDHLVVTADALEPGAAWLEELLGAPLAPGGRHPAMGTHNRLLSLGPDAYLEVIATDPAAEPPGRPRWFGLDARAPGPPRLAAWACRTDDLGAALKAAGPSAGPALEMTRGDLAWRIAVPEDGEPAMGGAMPALIAWHGAHPAPRLPPSGCALRALTLSLPDPGMLRAALPGLADPRVRLRAGPFGLHAEIETPAGLRLLE